jgi:hypothetical protein
MFVQNGDEKLRWKVLWYLKINELKTYTIAIFVFGKSWWLIIYVHIYKSKSSGSSVTIVTRVRVLQQVYQTSISGRCKIFFLVHDVHIWPGSHPVFRVGPRLRTCAAIPPFPHFFTVWYLINHSNSMFTFYSHSNNRLAYYYFVSK